MKRLLLAAFCMVVVCAPCAGQAQSRKEAMRQHKEAYALHQKARSNEDLKRAVLKYEEALKIYQKVGDAKNSGLVNNCLGLVHMDWHQYQKAVGYYEKGLGIFRKIGDVKDEGSALNNLGILYKEWGQYQKALEYYEKDLEICRKIGDLHGEGQTLMNLANVYSHWGQNQKAVEYYEKSLAITRKIGDVKTEGQTLANLGTVYETWGQYQKALEYYEKDLEICRKIGDVFGERKTLNNIGNVYSYWGRYQKAVEYYEKSLEIKRQIGDVKGEGKALNNLANVYTEWGQYQKGMEYYEKSLAITRKIGDVATEGKAINNLGAVYATLDEAAKAQALFEKGLAIARTIRVPDDRPMNSLANLFMNQGALEKAEPWIKQAGYNSTWGRYYLLKSDHKKAHTEYAQLLKSAEQTRNAEWLFTAYTGLGGAYEGLGENTKAAEHYAKAVRLTEEIRSGLSPNQRETFFDVRIEGFYRTAPYEGLARVMLKLNRPLESAKWSEYTKARLFAESISRRSGGGAAGVPREIVKQDEEITDQLAALKKTRQTAYEKNNKEQIAALEPQVKDLEAKQASHIKALRENYPLFAATKYPEPMDLAQSALKPDEWVLAYGMTDPGVIVYLTKGKELKKALFKPFPRKAVADLVRKFRKPFDDINDDNVLQQLRAFDFAAGKQLADLLLVDVLPEIPAGAPLIVVPDDALGVVPFEMLVLNQGGSIADVNGTPNITGAEFFGDRNPLSYYQSITALTLARNFGKEKGSNQKRLVMSDPIFDGEDERLKNMDAQKQRMKLAALPKQLMAVKEENGLIFPRLAATGALGKALKDMDLGLTDLLMGLDASKPALFKKPLDTYRSVVFATHGYFGKELAGIQEPVLVLTMVDQPEGQDGFLRLSEVLGLKLNAEVVALTACQSGLGRHVSGEGTMGMGRAFQYAGARSVLMSLWSVSERSSVKLVEGFFKHLKEGRTRLEAMKLARGEIRKAGYDHPFFWAPFILVGEVR